MSYSFGAIARGDTGATIEHANGTYLLACVRGALATPALESIKATFYRLATIDDAGARAVAAAAPSMLAEAVAIVLVANGRAFVACTGDASVLVHRGGVMSRVDGSHTLAHGDDLVASSGPLAPTGPLFAHPASPPPAEFRNDTLDSELSAALGTRIAVAALRVA